MKRILKIVGIVVALLVLVSVGTVASAFVGRQSITDGFEVNGIRIVKDGIVSVAFVPMGTGEVALIDAGNRPLRAMKGEYQGCNQCLSRLGSG